MKKDKLKTESQYKVTHLTLRCIDMQDDEETEWPHPTPPPKGVQEWLTNRPDKQGWPQPQVAMTTMIMIMMKSRKKEMTNSHMHPKCVKVG